MPPDDDKGQCERLLGKMHQVLSHDLPNQIVLLQSLVHLLELEEAEQLGEEGRERVHRLHRVARKAAGMVRYLKEMSRLAGYRRRVEEVALASLVREIDVELHQQLPSAAVECRLAGDSSRFAADPRRLVLAVVEIVWFLVDRFAGCRCMLTIRGQSVANGIAVHAELSLTAGATAALAEAPPERLRASTSLELTLAEEWLAGWGARITEVHEESDLSRFTLVVPTVVPTSSAHGRST
jgi:hypothetical protein